MQFDIRNYDMKAAKMEKTNSGRNLRLEVPGLAENRPSVLKGDELFAEPVNFPGRSFRGFVTEVQQTKVILDFPSKMMNL